VSDDGRPEVTVTNPVAHSRRDDVLVQEEPSSSRRPLLILLVALLLVGAVTGVGNVRERRAAAAVERELASTVELTVDTDDSSAVGIVDKDLTRLELTLRVRNTGPQRLTVVRMSLGDFRADVDAELASRGVSLVLLRLDVDCRSEPGLLRQTEPLIADVRTDDGVERRVDLGRVPEAFDATTSRQLCGYLTPDQAAGVSFHAAVTEDDALVLTVGLLNQERFPLVLDQVSAPDGLSVRVVDALLPLALPSMWTGPVLEDTRLQVRLAVDDCDAAVRLRARGVLRLELSDGRQASSELEVQPDGFEEFLARACLQG